MSFNSKMTAIADQIRELRGMSGSLSLDTMNTRLEEVRGYISDAFTAIGNKGGTVPTSKVSGNLVSAINSIPDGGDGVTVEQATPTIVVDNYGKITATAIQEAGQVEAGTKTATYQMRTLGYTEYTPGVDDQYLPLYRYVVGNQIIKGDANLVTENIKKGVSIFGVVGTYGGSGGGFGGGSDVISATGTYTPASDISSGVEIEHGLGVTPNYCIWMAENDFSDITDVSAAVVGAMVEKPMLHSVSSGRIYPYQYFLRGYNVSGLANGTASYKSEGYMTDTFVTILGNSTYKLKSGWTYRWVAGVINA